MSDALEERLAGVERKHGGYVSGGVGNGWRCWCGADLRDWWPEGGVTPRDTALDYALRAHRTAELLPLVEQEIAAARAEHGERIAQAIEAGYLGADFGRGFDGRESPDAALHHAYDEGLEHAARIARTAAQAPATSPEEGR